MLTIMRSTAKAVGLRNTTVATHSWRITTPRIYSLKLRLTRTAVKRLRPMRTVRFQLKSVLITPQGSSTTTSPVKLSRR
jgi:hypothetical protein